jgi:flavin reductase (DIM6/NTAB) family NADH-FMN oxidoreductase RutF
VEADLVTRVVNRLDTTGCVVTTAYEGRPAGCFVTYVSPASMEPERVMVFTSHVNLTHELVERSGVVAIHPLVRGQEAWIGHFGFQTGRSVDKFDGIAWHPGVTGAPILEDAASYLEGRVLASLDCGDHTARLVEPVGVGLRDPDAEPLTFSEILARGLHQG